MNATTPKTHVWNGTPIMYDVQDIPQYTGITFIQSLSYLWPDGNLRYVAVENGAVIAVQVDYMGFCNMVVNPLFSSGRLNGIYPEYANGVYRVPCIA